MKLVRLTIVCTLLFLVSCGGNNKKKDGVAKKEAKKEVVSKTIKAGNDLDNKGIGPIKKVDLPKEVNKKLAAEGQKLFKTKCSACHKTTKRYIGPSPAGVLKRRSPEWVMNMILNPMKMIQKDPIAKKLLAEYSAPMADQNLTEKEARAILEFFRTLK